MLVVAIILGVIYGARGSGTPDPTPTDNASTPAPTGTGVDACLGGPDLTAEQLFTAQQDAAHTPEGAVSYAASFARYVLQIPAPADADQAASWSGLSSEWWSRWADSASTWSGPNPLSVTTINGTYRVQSYTPDEAIITMELPWVIDGAVSSSKTFVPTVTVRWMVAGNWSVVELDSSAADDPATLTDSTEFTGGC
ncbi:hypothetical protein AB1K54_16940 [Microbacterium sp. BWT-B31]|uniref:hypothetical protein n=1 Tax=Microbacterium sp. BWT-B31 TaxID=3232072 RepID=UPI0035273FDE